MHPKIKQDENCQGRVILGGTRELFNHNMDNLCCCLVHHIWFSTPDTSTSVFSPASSLYPCIFIYPDIMIILSQVTAISIRIHSQLHLLTSIISGWSLSKRWSVTMVLIQIHFIFPFLTNCGVYFFYFRLRSKIQTSCLVRSAFLDQHPRLCHFCIFF